MHDDPRSVRPSVVNGDLVRAVEEKIRENRRFTITSLSLHFPKISRSRLHEIVSDKLKFRKLCARWVPKADQCVGIPDWEQFDNPPYSPDLAPSGFRLFLHLKSFLAGRRFHDDNEVKEAVTTCLHRRRHRSTLKGCKNWCPAVTSASTVVETMSKSSVRCVHQMAI